MPATLNNTGVLFNDSSQQSTAYLGHRVALYTSSSTFTPPAGVTQLKITAVGGGGGGGYYNGSLNNFGGQGGCIIALVTVTGGTTYTVTVGAGGAGSAALNYTNGTGGTSSAGGETWFGVNSSNKLVSAGAGSGSTGTWTYDPCLGWEFTAGATSDGTTSTTGTAIRSGDGISAGALTIGAISGAWIAWGLAYQLFGGRPVYAGESGSTAVTWTTSSKYIPGSGGVYRSSGAAAGGVSGLMLIEY